MLLQNAHVLAQVQPCDQGHQLLLQEHWGGSARYRLLLDSSVFVVSSTSLLVFLPVTQCRDKSLSINSTVVYSLISITTPSLLCGLLVSLHAWCCCSVPKLCLTVCNPMDRQARFPCPSLSPRVCLNSCPLSQWCHATVFSSVAPFSSYSHFPSVRVFSSESVHGVRWPKYWSFSISSFNEYPALISFRIDWFDHAWWGALIFTHHKTLSIFWACVPQFSLLKNKNNKIHFIRLLLGSNEYTWIVCLA